MRKEIKDGLAPVKQTSKKSSKQNQSTLSAKRFDVYNKASKNKAEGNSTISTQPAFEYYYDEYDEYLSS